MTGLLLSDARLRIPERKKHGNSVRSLKTLVKVLILSNLALSFQMLDTTKWQLEKSSIRLNYARTMISGLFFSGAVEYNSSKKYDVVLMGVAGGVINNFLRTMPNQVVSLKWRQKTADSRCRPKSFLTPSPPLHCVRSVTPSRLCSPTLSCTWVVTGTSVVRRERLRWMSGNH